MDKLSMALGMSTLEANFGLARINFDFSLYKVEAPKEYRELGEVLTARRRDAAESGSYHVTVRKLNALFEHTLPPIPRLVSAYGLRSSKIARMASDKNKGSSAGATHAPMYRIFPEHSGIDGTNIWAAATSGEQAVALHLLACMLARLWPPTEATSIWVELVAERKKRVQEGREAPTLACLAAIQVNITREQLAEWDAGARAWLRIADKAMERQQKQLMLIIGNVDIAVNAKMDVYDSVLQAWTSSLHAVENMLCDVPQTVQSGAVLLALSAWHLYPNLFVLGETSPKAVDLADGLMEPTAVLTLGLQNAHEHKSGDGVYWSLPLAYLRYYGPSIVSRRTMGSHSSRISFDQFLQIVLGCALRDGGFGDMDVTEAASLICGLYNELCTPSDSHHKDEALRARPRDEKLADSQKFTWLAPLARAASILLGSRGEELESSMRLIGYGKRRCNTLLGASLTPTGPVFGLGTPQAFLRALNGRESAIESIRKMIQDTLGTTTNEVYIIRYKVAENVFAYASGAGTLHRWSAVQLATDEKQDRISPDAIQIRKYGLHDSEVQQQFLVWFNPPSTFRQERIPRLAHLATKENLDSGKSSLAPKKKRKSKKRETQDNFELPSIILERIFGSADNDDDVALYGPPEHIDPSLYVFRHKDVAEALRKGLLYIPTAKKLLNSGSFRTPSMKLRDSLRVVQAAATVYEHLPDATVSIDITSHSIEDVQWVNRKRGGRLASDTGIFLDLADTFACIACFELGIPTIQPAGLGDVMALSIGNSIYISRYLLSDPTEKFRANEVRRIEGNIGKPGLAFMIPPKNPMVKTLANDTWNVITHATFDGKLENNFDATSLHLSFTDYVLPVDLGTHGFQDREAFFVESLVSIHDRGTWIADLDVMAAIRSELLSIVEIDFRKAHGDRFSVGQTAARVGAGSSTLPTCEYQEKKKRPQVTREQNQALHTGFGFPTTSVDCWNELLDPSLQTSVIRVHGNWLGRLGAAVLSVQLGFKTYVLPLECEDACRHCVGALMKHGTDKRRDVIIC
ncbi:hypothetical protein OQA88_8393 [Cercophora sp. LCS_1]